MRICCTALVPIVIGTLLVTPSAATAQVGIGGRLAWVTADSDADTDAVRFTGGQIRLLSVRWGLEVSIDQRSETFADLGEKVTERPIQASLLLRLAGGGFSPYLLGGPGWYRQTVKPIDDTDDSEVESTEFGWHAGGGLELRPARHFGIHADYRYTFLDFGDDDDDDGIIGGLLPGHRGSMWTLGATIYF
jgi:opacity protein-like surface antigen